MDFFILSIFSPNNKMDFCLGSDEEDIAVSLTHSARANGTYPGGPRGPRGGWRTV